MPFRLLLLPGLLGLALSGEAQQPTPTGYTIEGQDPRLAGRYVYLLAAERPTPTQPWPALDSVQADATGLFTLHGRVPAPDVYWRRLDRQRVLQPVPLAGRQEHLSASVELSPSSTRQAPVYQVADLQGMRVPTGHLYQLVGIPAIFLLDPAGRIVAKGLRGAALKQELTHRLK